MTRWLRSPTLHYLLIGGVLFASQGWWRHGFSGRAAHATAAKTIVISPAEVARIQSQLAARAGRAPDSQQLRTAIDAAIDDEILYQEALARGFDHDDEVVRQRLVSVMGFVADEAGREDEALYRDALQLGLDRHDLVVRRHLVQLMRLLARRPDVPTPVTDADLAAVVEREPERWRTPAEVTMTHVFLSASRRGAAVEDQARALLEKLRREHVVAERAPALGDPFPLDYELKRVSDRDLRRVFGAGFAETLATLEVGEWSGPVRSSYGEHLVWIHERIPPHVPPLDTIRPQLLQQLRAERGEERARAKMREWRSEYAIDVADVQQLALPLALTNDANGTGIPPRAERAGAVALPRPQPFLGD